MADDDRCIRRRGLIAKHVHIVSNRNAHVMIALNTLFSHLTGPGIVYQNMEHDILTQMAWYSFIKELIRGIMVYGYVAVTLETDKNIPVVIDGSLYVLIPASMADTGEEDDHQQQVHHTITGSTTSFIPLFRTSAMQDKYETQHIYMFIVFCPAPNGDLTSPVAQCAHLHTLLDTFTASCVTADVLNSQASAWETKMKGHQAGSITGDIMADHAQNPYNAPPLAHLMDDASKITGQYVESMQDMYLVMRKSTGPPPRAVLSTATDKYSTTGIDISNMKDPTLRIPTAPDSSITAVPTLHTRQDYIEISTQIARIIMHIMMVPPPIVGMEQTYSKHQSAATSFHSELLSTWTYNLAFIATHINTICSFSCDLINSITYLRSEEEEPDGGIRVYVKRPLNLELIERYPYLLTEEEVKSHYGYGGDVAV